MNAGCGGGNVVTVFDYVRKNGLVEESSYPYVSGRVSLLKIWLL